jgi:hypothetical protein
MRLRARALAARRSRLARRSHRVRLSANERNLRSAAAEGGWKASVDGGSNVATSVTSIGRSKRMLHHEEEDSADCNIRICGLHIDGMSANARSSDWKAGALASATSR